MTRCLLLLLVLLPSCSRGPGQTPMDQDGLVALTQPLDAPILFTMDTLGAPPAMLMPIFDEYRRTPLVMHVVWRTPQAPSSDHFAQFPGKKIKQYWDAAGLTPSTAGRLRIHGQLIAMDRLPLRLGLARAAAIPQ